jgi:hypothetical protein
MIIGIDLFEGDPNFLPCACPHCGSVENLDLSIEGSWDCPVCEGEFWIAHARVVTITEPGFAHARVALSDTDAAVDQ